MKYIFISAFIVVFLLLHILFYLRVIKKTSFSNKVKTALLYFSVVNFAFAMIYLYLRYVSGASSFLYYISSLSIGFTFLIFLNTVFYEIVNAISHFAPFNESKRDLFRRGSDLSFLALSSAYSIKAIDNGLKLPAIARIEVNQNIFKDTKRVVQISDMHISGLIDREFVKKSVAMINTLNADIVVITGDLIDDRIANLYKAVDELKSIKSKFGTYFILGNHEYIHNPKEILDYLTSINIKTLINENVQVDGINIIGVNDLMGNRLDVYKPNLAKAIKGIDKNLPTLLLAHQPKFIEELENFEPNLILSGHTHGGQIWPFAYLVKLIQPYLKGLHKISKKTYIYVNSGIGFWGPPMRLGSRAEITIIKWK